MIAEIQYKDAIDFLLPKHYSGRKPSISKAFAIIENSEIKAVCTFGKPASNSLCKGVCGESFSSNVYELNRLCRTEDYEKPLSKFVSECLRRLKPLNWIIVSYSDSAMNHNGYIYQACNFLFTGATKSRTDKYTAGNKHSRHYSKDQDNSIRKVRSAKNRYIYFCASSKKNKKEMEKNLKYKVLPYPKAENKNYVLGNFMETQIIQKQDWSDL